MGKTWVSEIQLCYLQGVIISPMNSVQSRHCFIFSTGRWNENLTRIATCCNTSKQTHRWRWLSKNQSTHLDTAIISCTFTAWTVFCVWYFLNISWMIELKIAQRFAFYSLHVLPKEVSKHSTHVSAVVTSDLVNEDWTWQENTSKL